MQPKDFVHGSQPWPDGLRLLHVYALVDLETNPRLARLIACRFAFRVSLSH